MLQRSQSARPTVAGARATNRPTTSGGDMEIALRDGPVHEADIQEAIAELAATFPFEGYFRPGLESHAAVAREISSRLPRGSNVLDIGCGPADKTAVLSHLGYRCTGIDDFNDPWHRAGSNFDRMRTFASNAGVRVLERTGDGLPFVDGRFDAVIVCDVIEHLHESPRILLADALRVLRADGLLLVTVPNAANLRKRLHLAMGRSNYPPYAQFFWNEGPWRGHVREYVWDDLAQLARHLALDDARISGCHHMLGVLPRWARPLYTAATGILPGARDSLMLVAHKPACWTPPRARARRDFAPEAACDGA
jgi:SAM-dependent methyltransferase